jgi:creatinine amidohydrolase
MRYGNLTYEEIRDRRGEGYIAIVPTGCTEQQGPHLPVDFDTWFAQELMEAAAERASREYGVFALVLPAIPFGPTPEHRNYGSGYINIPVEVHQQLIEAVLSSLAEQGFDRILIWRGCGGHDLAPVVAGFNATDRARVYLPNPPYHDIWCRLGDPAVPCGHADSYTTSICLYLRPQDVRTDRIVNPGRQSVDWKESDLEFARYSPTGVIGDPTHASSELGARLWTATVEAAALELRGVVDDVRT